MISGFLKILSSTELIDYQKSGVFFNIYWGLNASPKNKIPPFWYNVGDNSTPTSFKAIKLERVGRKWQRSTTESVLLHADILLLGSNYVYLSNSLLATDLEIGLYQLEISDGAATLYSEVFCSFDEDTAITGGGFSSGFSSGFN